MSATEEDIAAVERVVNIEKAAAQELQDALDAFDTQLAAIAAKVNLPVVGYTSPVAGLIAQITSNYSYIKGQSLPELIARYTAPTASPPTP